ncbi:unannotated protein [freshwater metagenome]|uniref:Unannotated protein n=1 Tax=freshwater metagenome TaxID=449393 RepID=A0A6J6RZF5_9ZZZZ
MTAAEQVATSYAIALPVLAVIGLTYRAITHHRTHRTRHRSRTG